jgi:chemotaxis protein MotA
MFVIIGCIVVLVSVVGGYLLEKGNFAMLIQPVEMLIIFGAGLGAFLVANPPPVIFATFQKLPKILGAGGGKNISSIYLKCFTSCFQRSARTARCRSKATSKARLKANSSGSSTWITRS